MSPKNNSKGFESFKSKSMKESKKSNRESINPKYKKERKEKIETYTQMFLKDKELYFGNVNAKNMEQKT